MAKKNSSEYWEDRIASATWNTYNSIEDKNRALLELYQDASKSIREELYTLAEKYSKDGVLTRSEMYKQNRLSKLEKRYHDIVEDLGHQTQEKTQSNMQNGFQEVYKGVREGLGEVDFALPNKKLMEELLEKPWRGSDFSERIWKNQKGLAVALNDKLLNGLQQGKTVTEIAVGLNGSMKTGFDNAHRLVRTETMHYLNNAALRGYKDAGIEYVQFWAARDERTCEQCGALHEKPYPIDKAPILPLHPHCRCTYLPVTDERLLEKIQMNEKAGDNGNNQSIAKEKKENQKRIQDLSKRYADMVQKYAVRESKWSGNIVFDDEKCSKEHVSGRKLWSCDILLRTNCQDRTIIHEHLHACSGSYLNPITYIPYGRIEEASVEFLAREICRNEGISYIPNKNKKVEYLREINEIADICETDLDFATALFAKPLKQRYNWLESKVEKAIGSGNVADKAKINKLLSELKGHK